MSKEYAAKSPGERQAPASGGSTAARGSPIAQGPDTVASDNRPEAVMQRQRASAMRSSPHVVQQKAKFDGARSSPYVVAQRQTLTVGSAGATAKIEPKGGAVQQFVLLDVGQAAPPNPVQSQADVNAAALRGDTLVWPAGQGIFNADYAGSVQRAMNWGLRGGEGTSGWYGRIYRANDFGVIATAAEAASDALAGIHASLNNEKNKTLIAIRAFRGQNNGSMAGRTQADLHQVYTAVSAQAAALHAAGLINNALAPVTSIEADPAEAHPNTLPTAHVLFGGAGSVYFKGRGPSVEQALIGNNLSAARSLSSLAGANADADRGVGMHGFIDPGGANNTQIAGDVGAEVPPALTPETAKESFLGFIPSFLGGEDVPPRPEAVSAWLSAVKGALLASLTATTDLHASNIKSGRTGKSHIIDAEFLLDISQWQAYQDMLGVGAIANFHVADFVPPWLRAHMATLSPGTRALMANQVRAGFLALQADQAIVQNAVLAPINALIATPALLRVIPLATSDFLAYVTAFQNARPNARDVIINTLWTDIDQGINQPVAVVQINNAMAAKAELAVNLRNGMVPVFHVRTNDGAFLLNKQMPIGQTTHGHDIASFLAQTRLAVTARYGDMATEVRNVVLTI